MGSIKSRYNVFFLVFIVLVAMVCLPINVAHATVQNIAVTKLIDEPYYKKTLFVITTDQTTYHIIVEANITTAGNETLIQLNATLYNPENETVLLSASIPDTLNDHPTIGGAPAVVPAIHITFPEWFVEDLVNYILPVAMLLAIIGEVYSILNNILTKSLSDLLLSGLLHEMINEAPLVWTSIPWVFRSLLITDSNNDGSFDLYIPISTWDLSNALLHGDYYIATAKNWWEIEQQEYYVQVWIWKVPLFTYYVPQWISSRGTASPPSQPPSASFTWRPLQPVVGEQVVFTSTSYATSPSGYISTQQWSLGDNTQETSANFTHSYQQSGNYTVILNVTDNNRLTNSVNATVSVQLAPKAQLRVIPDELSLEIQQGQNNSTQFLVGETLNQSDLLGVNFTAFDLPETFGNQTISSGNVTFNRNDITVTNGTYTNVTATFNAPLSSPIGWYSGNITATSANGGNATMFVEVFVYGPPTANFTWSPLPPGVGEVVTFDASSSISGGGPIVGYQWDFGDGQTASGLTAVHTYTSATTYLVTLNVTDSNGLWNTTQEQVEVVQAHGPEADFTANPETANVSQPITFDASTSQAGWNGTNQMPITKYSWDFGDGVTGSGQIATHAYSAVGNYTVMLNVTDSEGLWNSSEQQIQVIPSLSANYTLTVNVVGNGSVTVNPLNSNYGSGTNVTLTAVPGPHWTFWNWTGDVNGTVIWHDQYGDIMLNQTSIIMDGNKTVTATFGLLGDLNRDGQVNLADLIILAQTWRSRPGDPNWNPLCDIAAPYNSIGLIDMVTLALNYGRHM